MPLALDEPEGDPRRQRRASLFALLTGVLLATLVRRAKAESRTTFERDKGGY